MSTSAMLRVVFSVSLLIGWLAIAARAPAAEPAKAKLPKAEAKQSAEPKYDQSSGILAGQTPADVRIEKALDEPTEIECIEIPLSDLVEYLRTKHKLEIALDHKALAESGIALDTPITRHLKNVSLRSALDLILRELNLAWLVRDEVLLITTTEMAETLHETRVYPVEDLIARDAEALSKEAAYEKLMETIVTTVEPNTWSEVGGAGAIKALPVGMLVISQTYGVHQQIADVLLAIRTAYRQSPVASTAGDRTTLVIYPIASLARPCKVSIVPTATGSSYEITVNEGGKAVGGGESGDFEISAASSKLANSKSSGPQTVVLSNRGLADELARVIPKLVEPQSWTAAGGAGEIESVGSGLIVRQTQAVQHEIGRLLQSLPGTGRPSIREIMHGSGGMGQF